jgi:hypothetical protein
LSSGVDAAIAHSLHWHHEHEHIQQMVLAVEAELKGRKIPVSDLTTEAGIAPSTWSRWKSGDNSPTLKVWTQALDAKARLLKRGKRND